ncbi:MAG: gluconate 2-dehydrogenase subunit 3 family protein [Vicinamibacterales bacterium]
MTNQPDFGRRSTIQRLAMTAGGLLIFPGIAAAHPIQHHLGDANALELADAKASASDYVPELLDRHQFEMLQTLAERIVPGSNNANSAQFIDQLLAVSTSEVQRGFLQALGGFERFAMARVSTSWTHATEDQQNTLLTAASNEKPGTPPNAGAVSRARHVTIRDHFENLKGWIVGAYYSSEPGMRELGWTGNVFFTALPGCDHTDH